MEPEKSLENKKAAVPVLFELPEPAEGISFPLYLNPGYLPRGFVLFTADNESLADTYALAGGIYKWGFHTGILKIQDKDEGKILRALDFIVNKIKACLDDYLINKESLILFEHGNMIETALKTAGTGPADFFTGRVLHFSGSRDVPAPEAFSPYNYVCAAGSTASAAIAYCKNAFAKGFNYEIHIYADDRDMSIPRNDTNPGWWNSLNLWFNAHGWC
jgi:hypothetical protein